MTLDRRTLMMTGLTAALGACSDGDGGAPARPRSLKPLVLSPDRLMRITVCTRPFRAAGPRLDVEARDGKRVVHNYGHGGSGWSLAWGCAEDAARLALADGPSSIAVIGAGAIGLTTAFRLAQSGRPVTIYAAQTPAESRSSRATGVWSPDSRIAHEDDVGADFAARWERWARASFRRHQDYVGQVDHAVEFTPHFALSRSDEPEPPKPERAFLKIADRLNGFAPSWRPMPNETHPFPVDVVQRREGMTFNIASYSDRLLRDFFSLGGRLVRRRFADAAECSALAEPVIVNCTGYGARALWGDDSLTPVRGQIAWLSPQTDRLYAVYFNQVGVISRRDGVLIQYLGPNEDWGLGDDGETPDPSESERALAAVEPAFQGWA